MPYFTAKRNWAITALMLLGAVLLGTGVLLERTGRDTVCDPGLWEGPRNLRRCERYVFPAATAGANQLGVCALALGAGFLALGRFAPERRAVFRARTRSLALRALAVVSISFASGEIALRALFWDGASFGAHDGPLVRRYERNFVLNRHDGPSRGPEVNGPKPTGGKRIMIQGDSITWGQGVRHESQIFSQLLLDRLRQRNPRIEVAALAKGGREINGHLEQLRRRGAEIEPDAIIYQWYVNDIELNKSRRPEPHLPWRNLFFHRPLAAGSAFWFFLDYSIAQLWPSDRSYAEYLEIDYAAGTENWRRFEAVFGEWATEAKRLTPRVLVALFPRVNPPDQIFFPEVHERVRILARSHGLEALELADAFAGLEGDYEQLHASRFDPHPSALAHARVAAFLDKWLVDRWPDLFLRGGT